MKKVLKVVLGVVVFLIIGVNSLFFYKGSQSSKMPNKQTFQNMVLGECSEKPNCVSTFHKKDSNHKISPLKITKEQFKKVELPNNNQSGSPESTQCKDPKNDRSTKK